MDDKELRDLLLQEYKEVGLNWRYWGEVPWKQLTAYLTLTAVLAVAALSEFTGTNTDTPARPWFMRIILGSLGIILTLLFAVLEERATYYRRAYVRRALEIEEQLWAMFKSTGFVLDTTIMQQPAPSQYHVSHNPYWTLVRSDVVFRSFFSINLIAWTILAASADGLPLQVALVLYLTMGIMLLFGPEVAARLQYRALFRDGRQIPATRRVQRFPKGCLWVLEYLDDLLTRVSPSAHNDREDERHHTNHHKGEQ